LAGAYLMKKSCYNRRGFTLAEGMIALVVLTVAAGGVLMPYSSGASLHVEGSRRTMASKLAADLVEEITASLEQVDDSDYKTALNFWDGFTEDEGEVTKVWGYGSYSGEVYEYFSRSAVCKEAVIGSDRNLTSLGVWVTVTVCYDSREMSTLKTLVCRSN